MPWPGDVVEARDGTRLRVVTAGNGSTAVLVHGFGVSADEWNLIQPSLVASGWNVIAYDQRGHGRSTIGSDGLTATALWRDFATILTSQDVSDAVIVCHSMGNFVGLGALGLWPELQQRVRAVVCVAPVTGHATRDAPAARLQVPLVRAGLAQYITSIPPVGRLLARANLGPYASDSIVEATRGVLASIPRGLAPLARVLANESISSLLPDVAVPVTVLNGDADELTPRWHAALIVERAQNARLVEIPNGGHMLNWEDPQAIIDAVMEFAR